MQPRTFYAKLAIARFGFGILHVFFVMMFQFNAVARTILFSFGINPPFTNPLTHSKNRTRGHAPQQLGVSQVGICGRHQVHRRCAPNGHRTAHKASPPSATVSIVSERMEGCVFGTKARNLWGPVRTCG